MHANVEEFQRESDIPNVLIGNADVMAGPEGQTADRVESQSGTNHLAQFLLFYLLKPPLLSSSTRAFDPRVIILASNAHCISSVHFRNLDPQGEYETWKALASVKVPTSE